MLHDNPDKESLLFKVKFVTPEFTDFEVEAKEPATEQNKKLLADLRDDVEDSGYPYRVRLFKALIKKSWSGFTNFNIKDSDAEKMLNGINKSMFNNLSNALFVDSRGQTPQGFLYGYEPQEITADDLTYVDPEPGSTEYTYSESSRVLGRSLTNNPRVQFLDPAEHGGSYSAPFYNILAEEKQGWSLFAKSIVSNLKGCDDAESNFMFFKDITDKIDEDEGKIKRDERLKLAPDCVVEKPFDKIASPTTLATLGGITTSIIRMHIVDFMIRTFPINSSVSLDFNKNHNKIISKFIAKRMRTSLSNERSAFVSTYEGGVYWLLFLEQAVQTLKRKIDNAEIESNDELTSLMNTLNDAQKAHKVPSYSDLKLFKDIKVIDLTSDAGQGLAGAIAIGSLVASAGLGAAAIAISATVFSVSFSAFKLSQATFAAKLGTLYSVEDECMEALSYLIEEQLNFYSDVIAETIEPRPRIHDISKFFIGASKTMIKGDIRAGEAEIEAPTGGTSNFDYGEIPSCINDINTLNPLSLIAADDPEKITEIKNSGGLFLEKYLRIEDKKQTPMNLSQQKIQLNRDFVDNRSSNLIDVVGIEAFKNFLKQNENQIPADSNVSDFFGNAKLRLIDKGYSGSIGIKFGVRLCCVMPSGFRPFDNQADEVANVSKANKEKNYILNPDSRLQSSRYIFPLCSFERDVPDNKLASYINSDENFNQELKCYVDGLTQTPEFRLLFDHILNIKKVPSLVALYSYLNFYPSLGKGDGERNDSDDIAQPKLDRIFNDTRSELRKLFVSNYKRKDFDPPNEEESEGGLIQNLTRGALAKSFNNIFMAPDIPWWLNFRYRRKKVDEDGEVCKNQFGSLVSVNKEE